MLWQDYVISFASLVFMVSLLPMVLRGTRIPLLTSASTSSGLWVIAFAMLTLDLLFSAAVTAATAFMWSVLVANGVKELS